MGCNSAKEEPKKEEKTIKQLVKEHMRTINKLRREFQKEINQLQQNNDKIRRDMEGMVKRKEPKSNVKIIASSMLKNQNFIVRYQRLDAQLADMQFQLQSTATCTTLVECTKEMNKILGKVNSEVDMKNIQQVIEEFSQQVDQQEAIGEQINGLMDTGNVEIDDAEVDKQIAAVEIQVQKDGQGAPGQGGMQQKNVPIDIQQMEAELNKTK